MLTANDHALEKCQKTAKDRKEDADLPSRRFFFQELRDETCKS